MIGSSPSAVFLDRDGTIIDDVRYITDPDQARLIPGAAEAIADLNHRGIPVIVVTNQSGIARGLQTLAEYEAVRERVASLLRKRGAHIDASYFCPHHPDAGGPCDCRKPATRLFRDAADKLGVSTSEAAYLGDRWRDVAPAIELGGRGILVPSSATTDEDRRLAAAAGIESASTLQEATARLFSLTQGSAAK